MGHLIRSCFAVSVTQIEMRRRGFRATCPQIQRRLEQIGRVFLNGYHLSLEHDDPARLSIALNHIESEQRGFAFEGAGMGLALRDILTLNRRSYLQRFMEGVGGAHLYMLHVGAGWAFARLRRRVEPALVRFDPLLRGLVLDGFGFHQGFFHPDSFLKAQTVPTDLGSDARRVFDQGLGRSLWFVQAAQPAEIATEISKFAAGRHQDLWSGVGLACAYAGGIDTHGIAMLADYAAEHLSAFAQGVAFATKARQRADNPADHTDRACTMIWRLTSEAVVEITDEACRCANSQTDTSAYESWQHQIRSHFCQRMAMNR